MTQDLIERALDGDESAACALHSDHYPAVFRLAFMLLQNREDADDAAQDTFVYAFSHLNGYDPARSKFASWLKIIVTSRCRDQQRRRRTRTTSLQDLMQSGREPEDTVPDHRPDAAINKIGLQQTVSKALTQVPRKSRQALILRFYGDLTYPEMAQALGCSVSTVKSRVAYGLRVLSPLLESADDLGGD
jgi:RNA polymerase sigma-70 factor, ECF subfamily